MRVAGGAAEPRVHRHHLRRAHTLPAVRDSVRQEGRLGGQDGHAGPDSGRQPAQHCERPARIAVAAVRQLPADERGRLRHRLRQHGHGELLPEGESAGELAHQLLLRLLHSRVPADEPGVRPQRQLEAVHGGLQLRDNAGVSDDVRPHPALLRAREKLASKVRVRVQGNTVFFQRAQKRYHCKSSRQNGQESGRNEVFRAAEEASDVGEHRPLQRLQLLHDLLRGQLRLLGDHPPAALPTRRQVLPAAVRGAAVPGRGAAGAGRLPQRLLPEPGEKKNVVRAGHVQGRFGVHADGELFHGRHARLHPGAGRAAPGDQHLLPGGGEGVQLLLLGGLRVRALSRQPDGLHVQLDVLRGRAGAAAAVSRHSARHARLRQPVLPRVPGASGHWDGVHGPSGVAFHGVEEEGGEEQQLQRKQRVFDLKSILGKN